VVPDLDNIGMKFVPLLAIRLSASALASPMNRKETLRRVIFRTMEFGLMSSEKVAVGLRIEMVRPGSRFIVSHSRALK